MVQAEGGGANFNKLYIKQLELLHPVFRLLFIEALLFNVISDGFSDVASPMVPMYLPPPSTPPQAGGVLKNIKKKRGGHNGNQKFNYG